MDAKELVSIQKPIIEALQQLETPLSTIALLKLVDEFYTKDERTAAYAKYAELRDADNKAYEGVLAARLKENLGHEEMIEKYGKEKTTALLEPTMRAGEIRRGTMKDLSDFTDANRLIVRLLEAKGEMGKNRFE